VPDGGLDRNRVGQFEKKPEVVTLPKNPHPAMVSSANGALLYQPRAKPWVQIESQPKILS
jgi:hypothetical protein